jgi:hypothetical protein
VQLFYAERPIFVILYFGIIDDISCLKRLFVLPVSILVFYTGNRCGFGDGIIEVNLQPDRSVSKSPLTTSSTTITWENGTALLARNDGTVSTNANYLYQNIEVEYEHGGMLTKTDMKSY